MEGSTVVTDKQAVPDPRTMLGPVGAVGRAQRRDAFARVASLLVFLMIFGPVYGIWLGPTFLNSDALLFAGHSESFQHAADLFHIRGRTVYTIADKARHLAVSAAR